MRWGNTRIGDCKRSIVGTQHRIDRRVGLGSEKGRNHRNVAVVAAGSCSLNNPSLRMRNLVSVSLKKEEEVEEEEGKSTDTDFVFYRIERRVGKSFHSTIWLLLIILCDK